MANVNTPPFRVSYPSVFKATKNKLNGKDEYSLVALFPKDADLKELKAAAQKAIVEKWGPDKAKWPANLRTPFRDQGEKVKVENGKEILPAGYEKGSVFLTLRSTQRPGVVDQSVQDIIDESQFYAGCWARASVRAYAYDNMGNRGIAFGLGNIQKVKDGDPLGGRTRAEDDFSPIEGAAGKPTEGASATSLFD